MNINSIRNKLSDLECLIGDFIDIICVAETKIDGSFPSSQFVLSGFKSPPYRLDVTDKSGGLLTFVKSDIPSRQLSASLPNDVQILSIELNLRKSKWLLLSVYRPPKQGCKYFLDKLSECILYFSTFDSIIVIGDMNLEPDSPEMSNFIESHSFFNHMKQKTCWKSSRGSCIDLILSNKKHSLFNTGTLETGLSDHHSLVYSMLKTTFQKLPSQKISYRKWKNFDKDLFNNKLLDLMPICNLEFSTFNKIFIDLLDQHAPRRTKFLRGNNQPYISKILRKAIMKRSRLKSIANKFGVDEDLVAYKRQRNLVVNMNRQAKKTFLADTLPTSKRFWEKIKPFFNSKNVSSERILLVGNGNIITNEDKLVNVFNEFFNSITDSLNIPIIPSVQVVDSLDPVMYAISKYANHPSILKIKSITSGCQPFKFEEIAYEIVLKEIDNLNSGKSVSGPIPVKALKAANSLCSHFLTACFNQQVVSRSIFPDELKLADVIPIFKKGCAHDKSNYRLISLLPVVSKVFEKLIAKQFNPFIEQWFSKNLCGFRKGHSTQHALLKMLRK